MIKTAITGNIASGKSQVEKILITKGFKVIDSDIINNDLLYSNIDVIKKIKLTFNEDIWESDLKISKQKLAQIIFSSQSKRKRLESILHPLIMQKINEFFIMNSSEKVVFASVPLLFEVKWENNFDKIIFISADENIRLKRLIKRNNYSVEYALQRIYAQDSEKNKILKSDYVIYNNSTFENLEKNTTEVIDKMLF